MAMHNTDGLYDTAEILYKELSKLGIESSSSGFGLVDEKEKRISFYGINPTDGKIIRYANRVPIIKGSKPIHSFFSDWKKQATSHIRELSKKETVEHETYVAKCALASFKEYGIKAPFTIEEWLASSPKEVKLHFFNFRQGCIYIIRDKRLTEAQQEMVARFTKVFQLTYTRFLDLQKAEAQAREAQIEAALERVRSRSMAMHNTSELQEVIHTVHKELLSLQLAIYGGSFIVINRDINNELRCWGSGGTADTSEEVYIPRFEKPFVKNLINAIKKGPGFFTEEYSQDEKKEFFTFLFKHQPWANLDSDKKKEVLKSPGGYTRSCSVMQHTSIFIINQSGRKFTEAENDILLRFAKVFEQTYTRFLDLQKAEAQAREAQIELGLERVRARAMAMQKSDELSELVDTVFKELTKLDFALTWCIINIIDETSMSNTVWAANPDINKAPESYHMLFEDYPFHHAMMKGWKERKTKYVYTLEGNEKKIYDEYLFSETEFKRTPEAAQAASRAMEKYVVSFSFSNFGGLQTVGDVPLSDANLDILSRFGKVFDLTYTRFNDLKQAEAQARESQIQLALERVRARTMAMQKSDELAEAASLLFTQIADLGTNSWSSGFIIFQPDELSINSWMSKPDGSMGVPFNIPVTEDPFFIKIYEAYKRGEEFFVMESGGKELEETYRYMFGLPGAAKALGAIEDIGFQMPTFQITHCTFFPQGFLMFITYEPCPEMWDIFKRFGKVFEQTYTRFLDLQKAEAQARESQIQLALKEFVQEQWPCSIVMN